MKHKILTTIHQLLLKDYRILKIIFTVFATLLIYDTFYTLFVRKPTFASDEKRSISWEDFPEIVVCPENSTDKNALMWRGYESAEHCT